MRKFVMAIILMAAMLGTAAAAVVEIKVKTSGGTE